MPFPSETGSPITASCIGLGNSKTPPPGQAGKCVPGYNGKSRYWQFEMCTVTEFGIFLYLLYKKYLLLRMSYIRNEFFSFCDEK